MDIFKLKTLKQLIESNINFYGISETQKSELLEIKKEIDLMFKLRFNKLSLDRLKENMLLLNKIKSKILNYEYELFVLNEISPEERKNFNEMLNLKE